MTGFHKRKLEQRKKATEAAKLKAKKQKAEAKKAVSTNHNHKIFFEGGGGGWHNLIDTNVIHISHARIYANNQKTELLKSKLFCPSARKKINMILVQLQSNKNFRVNK